MDKDHYINLNELIKGEQAYKGFRETDFKFFEACLPIEEIASRGLDTMRFGVEIHRFMESRMGRFI